MASSAMQSCFAVRAYLPPFCVADLGLKLHSIYIYGCCLSRMLRLLLWDLRSVLGRSGMGCCAINFEVCWCCCCLEVDLGFRAPRNDAHSIVGPAVGRRQ
jgi:hypothetical protein